MFGYTRSGKRFRNQGKVGPKYSPLIEPPSSDDEGATKASPHIAVQLIRQGFLWIPHLSTPPPPSPPQHTPSPTPPPPSSLVNMSNTMKFPVFKGLGSEDPDQFWFVAKAMRIAKQIIDDHINKAQLVTTLQDRTLTWYIKYCTDNLVASLADTQTALNKEFSRPKSETQSVVGFKEIAMRIGETSRELDQRLKCGIQEANMNLIDS